MDIFNNYIEKHCNYKPFIEETPEKEIWNVIVIPALGEPGILETLICLSNCTLPQRPVEVIVVLNSSESASTEVIELNRRNELEISKWSNSGNTSKLKVFPIIIENIPKKNAGAGYARKTGMDEAILRFIKAGKTDGIITSLDADSLVSKNYLVEIEKLFINKPKCNACSIYFEHPIEGNDFSEDIYKTIIEYELHLRYYKQMLQYIGFPYYHHTVGSCFAVRATTYCAQGGMNKKQAGEDFYFLHKIMPLGNYCELNSICVCPSPRPSNRVPFGTGATIREYALETKTDFFTYNFNCFKPLKKLFTEKELIFKANTDKIEDLISRMDQFLQEFLNENDFKNALTQINGNCRHIQTFNNRFFAWFDAFKIIKYLNFMHHDHFKKQAVREAVMEYFNEIGIEGQSNTTAKSLLHFFRNLEKETKEFF